MGAPIGNKNAIKNRGGGRKSAYQEKQDAKFWNSLLVTPIDRRKLEKKLKTGVFTMFDVMQYKIITGDDKILLTLMNKMIPKYDWKLHESIKTRKEMEKTEKTMRALLEKAKPNICAYCQRDMNTLKVKKKLKRNRR